MKIEVQRQQAAEYKTVGGVTSLNSNKELYADIPIPDRIKKELIPTYVKSKRYRFYAEKADLKRQEERRAERIKDAEVAISMKMEAAAIKSYTYFCLQRLSTAKEMTFALSQRKPGRANSNPEKHRIAFLTEQCKSYCFS